MNIQQVHLWPGASLEIEQRGEWIESGLQVADPDWRFLDAKGHGHFYDAAKTDYPTLWLKFAGCGMDHGDDCRGDSYFECRICGERIMPRTKVAAPEYVEGRSTFRLTVLADRQERVYSFPVEKWRELQAVWSDAVESVLGDHLIEVLARW